MLHQIKPLKAHQFYTDLGLYLQFKVLQKIVKFKNFSIPFSDLQVLFKSDIIFKDFSRKHSIFKYIFNPV